MLILDFFEQVANFGASLELTARVARFLKKLAQAAQESKQRLAVAETLQEWEDVAGSLDPRIRLGLRQVPETSLGLRAEALAYLAEKYAASPRQTAIRAILPSIRHTRVEKAGSRVLVSFGQSAETHILSKEQLSLSLNDLMPSRAVSETSLPGGAMDLPVFKVTMLGGSASGKTVFMASMYAKLRDGSQGISIRAVEDKVDLELGDIMENLYKFNRWPPNSEFDQKQYDFELMLGGRSIARIDWVDYRGGALLEGDEGDGGSLLSQRLQDSNAILWMVDMSTLADGRLDGLKQRIETKVARMAHLCRALKNHDVPRAWVFVRTKADMVRDPNGSPNWEKACADLIRHLGEAVQIASSGVNSRVAALPVSAAGRVALDSGNKLIDDTPFFVEWPLILALAFLVDVELTNLQRERGEALKQHQGALAGQLSMRRVLQLVSNKEEVQARDKANTLKRQLVEMAQVISGLLQNCPPVVKLLHDRKGLI